MAKSLTLQLEDEAPALMLDGDFKLPPPLDRRIAAVWLRATTNNPTDGYDVSLSAAFGREKIILKADEFELEVQFSLKTADIELVFDRCDHTLLRSNDGRPEGWRTTHTERETRIAQLEASAHADASLHSAYGVSGSTSAKVAAQQTRARSALVEHHQTHGEWHLIGDAAVRVGRGKMLEGCVISDFTGWRAVPRHTDQTSGVLARIVVREDWINFDDATWIRAPHAFRRKLAELFQLSGERGKRKELFLLLLRHLAQSELRNHQRDREAIIAVHAIRVRPAGEAAIGASVGVQQSEISIPSRPLEQFLMSEEGHEESTLVALGVRPDLIPANRRRHKFFVPEGSPLAALELLRRVAAAHPRPVVADQEFTRLPNELRDLRALKLVDYRNGEIKLKANPDVVPEISLRRAVAEAETIQTTRSLLLIRPEASAIDVAEAVALELGRPWVNRATKQRHGGAIRRWMVWLEPHLIDPNSSGEAAALVMFATSDQTSQKGRPPMLTSQMQETLRELFACNTPAAVIAERFKVTPQAVYKWRKKLGFAP